MRFAPAVFDRTGTFGERRGSNGRRNGLTAARGSLFVCDVYDKPAEPAEDVADVIGMHGARLVSLRRDPERLSVTFIERTELKLEDHTASRSARDGVANEFVKPGV